MLDFTLSNARRLYLSVGEPLGSDRVKYISLTEIANHDAKFSNLSF